MFQIRKATENDTPIIFDLIKKLAVYEKMEDEVITSVEELHKNNLPSDDQILILQKRLNASKNTAHAISKQHKALSAATTVVFAQKRYIQDQMSISEEEMEDTYNAFEKCYSDVGNQLFYFQRFYDQSFYNGIPFKKR